jgi:hypothetical protein
MKIVCPFEAHLFIAVSQVNADRSRAPSWSNGGTGVAYGCGICGESIKVGLVFHWEIWLPMITTSSALAVGFL